MANPGSNLFGRMCLGRGRILASNVFGPLILLGGELPFGRASRLAESANPIRAVNVLAVDFELRKLAPAGRSSGQTEFLLGLQKLGICIGKQFLYAVDVTVAERPLQTRVVLTCLKVRRVLAGCARTWCAVASGSGAGSHWLFARGRFALFGAVNECWNGRVQPRQA